MKVTVRIFNLFGPNLWKEFELAARPVGGDFVVLGKYGLHARVKEVWIEEDKVTAVVKRQRSIRWYLNNRWMPHYKR